MAPQHEDDWSDSDDDEVTDVETSVQLGIPDGPLASTSDLLDAAVSRIGGHPAFLTAPAPPLSSALCKNCSMPMELLVQIWCPLEESPCDRALYVWGCARGVCQKMEGSVRAWRGLRFNEQFAAKLELKKERQRQKELVKAKAAEEEAKAKAAAKKNPFSMKSAPGAPASPFGLGTAVFGQSEPEVEEGTEQDKAEYFSDSEDEKSESEDDDEDSLVTAMASTSLENSEWASAPAYDALYLSTSAEYLPPAPKVSIPKNAQVIDADADPKAKDGSWALEGYENSLDIDHAFERFTKRVGYEGEQCIRYELGGTPLPFASDKVFDRLFPAPPKPNLPVTKPDSMVVPAQKREYDPSSIAVCPHCKGRRAFECQLMPNLINVLKSTDAEKKDSKKSISDEERRKEVEKILKGGADVERTGMDWGTCMIFSCEKDCCVEDGAQLKSCWREEEVLIQWDV